jgi:hypothetical protein
MKRLLLGLVLAMTAGAASAASVEWTQVGKTGDSDYDFAIFVNLSEGIQDFVFSEFVRRC